MKALVLNSGGVDSTTCVAIAVDKYGKDNVHKVTSIDKFLFDDEDLKELNHIKLGCI